MAVETGRSFADLLNATVTEDLAIQGAIRRRRAWFRVSMTEASSIGFNGTKSRDYMERLYDEMTRYE